MRSSKKLAGLFLLTALISQSILFPLSAVSARSFAAIMKDGQFVIGAATASMKQIAAY